MKYIEAPMDYNKEETQPSIFLAGGITDCPNWQSEMVNMLTDTDLTILNPRRANFPIHDPDAAYTQIAWEHSALRTAEVIQFWFPKETLCPIVLYELGAWSMKDKPIFIGMSPEYSRRRDVEIQTKLVRPEIKIAYSLSKLADQIHVWYIWYIWDTR